MQVISQKRIIICGTNGTGKSTVAEKLINASLTASPNKKCLALLPDDEEAIFRPYSEIRESEIKNIHRYPTGKYKTYFNKLAVYDDVLTYFKNGIFVMDDAKAYVTDSGNELRPLYIRSRQGNFHIVFICHGLSEIPPKLFTWSTEMILFNTTDTWERLKQKIPNPTKFATYVNDIRAKANTHVNGCNPRIKCTCGNGYKYKVIDLKRDLL